MEMEDVAVARLAREPQARKPPEQGRERDLQLDPGERRADAEMNAGAEADILPVKAERVEPVRIPEARGVAVGRAQGPGEHDIDRGGSIVRTTAGAGRPAGSGGKAPASCIWLKLRYLTPDRRGERA